MNTDGMSEAQGNQPAPIKLWAWLTVSLLCVLFWLTVLRGLNWV